MKPAITVPLLIATAIICFLLAGLSLMSTGMFDEGTGQLNEYRVTQVLRGLDALPAVYIDVEGITFSTQGRVTALTRESMTVDETALLLDAGVPDVRIDDLVRAEYRYAEEGQRLMTKAYAPDPDREDCYYHIYDPELRETVHACPVELIQD